MRLPRSWPGSVRTCCATTPTLGLPGRAFARAARRLASSSWTQKVIAGLGNIYRTEILWRQRIHPETEGRLVMRDQFDAFWSDAAALLRIGVDKRAIITIDGAKRGKTRYGARTNIFKKKTCPRCESPVRQFTMASRKVFCCDTCQVKGEAAAEGCEPKRVAMAAR